MKMDRATIIEQLEAIIASFVTEYGACPIALYEAVDMLREDGKKLEDVN